MLTDGGPGRPLCLYHGRKPEMDGRQTRQAAPEADGLCLAYNERQRIHADAYAHMHICARLRANGRNAYGLCLCPMRLHIHKGLRLCNQQGGCALPYSLSGSRLGDGIKTADGRPARA